MTNNKFQHQQKDENVYQSVMVISKILTQTLQELNSDQITILTIRTAYKYLNGAKTTTLVPPLIKIDQNALQIIKPGSQIFGGTQGRDNTDAILADGKVDIGYPRTSVTHAILTIESVWCRVPNVNSNIEWYWCIS